MAPGDRSTTTVTTGLRTTADDAAWAPTVEVDTPSPPVQDNLRQLEQEAGNGSNAFTSAAAINVVRPEQPPSRLRSLDSTNAADVQHAFVPGKEGEARRTIFNRISRHYDELNDMLSLGQHWVWKAQAVKWSRARPGQRVLDVCCGSGDIAFVLAKVVGPKGQVVGLDFADGMLRDAAARQRACEEELPPYRRPQMQWVQGDAMELPFEGEQFDAATMGYGLRNVADIPRTLRELRRVLRPGASVAILDFNNSIDPMVDQLQAAALEWVVVPYARRFGLEAEYAYLRPSIKRFPTGPEQERMGLEAGFASARHYPVGFGLMGVLVATKGLQR